MVIGVVADHRLQQGGGHLKGQGDQTDLGEAELKSFLKQGIDGRDQRLDKVVEEMGTTDGEQHLDTDAFRLSGNGMIGRGMVSHIMVPYGWCD
jgi:hypothetical protein